MTAMWTTRLSWPTGTCSSTLSKARPYWQHVSCDADAYKNHTLLFWTPIV